jgi:small subunit ribosomal protein S16
VAVKIRLMRVGKKKQPTYRVVVADGRSPRDGRFIEIIGRYEPRQEPSAVEIDAESALAWLRKGAQPTEQVQKLLAVTGVWEQYEAERGSPAVTKLSRRAYVTGREPARAKAPKAAPAAEPAAEGVAADTGDATETSDAAEASDATEAEAGE